MIVAVTFRTTKGGEWVSLKPKGEELGKSFSKMEVYYYGQPRGGKLPATPTPPGW